MIRISIFGKFFINLIMLKQSNYSHFILGSQNITTPCADITTGIVTQWHAIQGTHTDVILMPVTQDLPITLTHTAVGRM